MHTRTLVSIAVFFAFLTIGKAMIFLVRKSFTEISVTGVKKSCRPFVKSCFFNIFRALVAAQVPVVESFGTKGRCLLNRFVAPFKPFIIDSNMELVAFRLFRQDDLDSLIGIVFRE